MHKSIFPLISLQGLLTLEFFPGLTCCEVISSWNRFSLCEAGRASMFGFVGKQGEIAKTKAKKAKPSDTVTPWGVLV